MKTKANYKKTEAPKKSKVMNIVEATDVIIVMGSQSDFEVMNGAAETLDKFDVKNEMLVVSAHRTPALLEKSVAAWEKDGVKVIIAGAGGAAHLPGMLAAFSILPVIGVPVKTKNLSGLDSLLSIVQMPPGVPVATVGVNGAVNAGLLAIKILNAALGDKSTGLKKKLTAHKNKMYEDVMEMQKNVAVLSKKKKS